MLKTFIVGENQRGLLIQDGRLITILQPGRHRVWDWGNRKRVELHTARGLFGSDWAEIIEKRHPALAAANLETVRTGEGEVAVIYSDGRAAWVVRPGQVAHVWTLLEQVRVERFDVEARPRLDRRELVAFERAVVVGSGPWLPIATVSVGEAEAGLVFFDGELVEALGPGRYGYWQVGRKVTAKMLDIRPKQ